MWASELLEAQGRSRQAGAGSGEEVTTWVNSHHSVAVPSGGLGEGMQLTSARPRRLFLQYLLPGWIVERQVLMDLYFMSCDFNIKLSGSDS